MNRNEKTRIITSFFKYEAYPFYYYLIPISKSEANTWITFLKSKTEDEGIMALIKSLYMVRHNFIDCKVWISCLCTSEIIDFIDPSKMNIVIICSMIMNDKSNVSTNIGISKIQKEFKSISILLHSMTAKATLILNNKKQIMITRPNYTMRKIIYDFSNNYCNEKKIALENFIIIGDKNDRNYVDNYYKDRQYLKFLFENTKSFELNKVLNKNKIDIYDLRSFIKYIISYEEEINSTFFEFIPRMKNYKEIFTEISKPLNKNRKLKNIINQLLEEESKEEIKDVDTYLDNKFKIQIDSDIKESKTRVEDIKKDNSCFAHHEDLKIIEFPVVLLDIVMLSSCLDDKITYYDRK
jgi:hypothetical protein